MVDKHPWQSHRRTDQPTDNIIYAIKTTLRSERYCDIEGAPTADKSLLIVGTGKWGIALLPQFAKLRKFRRYENFSWWHESCFITLVAIMRRLNERTNMTTESTSHPLRATFKSTVDAILATQTAERGRPEVGPKGEKRDGWTWRQEDSIELISTLACELSSLQDKEGSISDADLLVFRDLINHPVNPSAFRQRLEEKGRIPKGEGRKSLKQSNADLF